MSGVMIYPIPSMSQCECYCPWNASQCVSYALLSPTRYKTFKNESEMANAPGGGSGTRAPAGARNGERVWGVCGVRA